jgi:hypothetical protein
MPRQEVPVDSGQQAQEAVPASDEEDRLEAGVGGEIMEGGEALAVVAGEEPLPAPEVARGHGLEAEGGQAGEAAL